MIDIDSGPDWLARVDEARNDGWAHGFLSGFCVGIGLMFVFIVVVAMKG